MPVCEERTLRFDAEALEQAIRRCEPVARRLGLPQAAYLLISFRPECQQIVVCDLARGGSRTVIVGSKIAPLLVAYSRKLGIPLPRIATKRVTVEPRAIAFTLYLRHGAE